MDPLIRDQIDSLRASTYARDHALASTLEVVVGVREELVEVKAQTTKTNGRVTALEQVVAPLQSTTTRLSDLERKHLGVISCPGKCIDLEKQLISAISTIEEQDSRVRKLEEPVRVRGAIWHGIVSSFTGVSAVLAVVFGFLYIPGVSEHIFEQREKAAESSIARIVAEEIVKQNAQPTPAPAHP